MSDHVQHLLTAYIHHQLPRAERSRVLLHLQTCPECRLALRDDEQLEYDLQTIMPGIGRPAPGQLARLWPAVWADYRKPRSMMSATPSMKPVGMALALFTVCIFASSALFGGQTHVEAAPLPPVPMEIRPTDTPVQTESPGMVTVIIRPSARAVSAIPTSLVSPVPVADGN